MTGLGPGTTGYHKLESCGHHPCQVRTYVSGTMRSLNDLAEDAHAPTGPHCIQLCICERKGPNEISERAPFLRQHCLHLGLFVVLVTLKKAPSE